MIKKKKRNSRRMEQGERETGEVNLFWEENQMIPG